LCEVLRNSQAWV